MPKTENAFPPQNLEQKAKKNLREAIKKWKEAKRNTMKHCDAFMEQLVEATASGGNVKVEGELKSLWLKEKQRINSTKSRKINGKGRSGGVVTVVA